MALFKKDSATSDAPAAPGGGVVHPTDPVHPQKAL